FGRFSDVHIGGSSSNQAATLESQMIHPIQLLPGRTLRSTRPPRRGVQPAPRICLLTIPPARCSRVCKAVQEFQYNSSFPRYRFAFRHGPVARAGANQLSRVGSTVNLRGFAESAAVETILTRRGQMDRRLGT